MELGISVAKPEARVQLRGGRAEEIPLDERAKMSGARWSAHLEIEPARVRGECRPPSLTCRFVGGHNGDRVRQEPVLRAERIEGEHEGRADPPAELDGGVCAGDPDRPRELAGGHHVGRQLGDLLGLLLDLVEIPSLGIVALLGTDLAEALILPGLVVGIAELLALSQIYVTKEGLREKAVRGLNIEVIQADAPLIISVLLICYGIVLSGFTGGGVAGLGVVFYFMARGHREHFELLEMASGISWAIWIFAFFVFMFIPEYWLLALFMAAIGILMKVIVKMSLVGTMWGDGNG